MPASTAFSGTTAISTPPVVYYGDYSDENEIRITHGNCIPEISSFDQEYGELTITYVLKNDRATDCSIRLYYSTDGGTTFSVGSVSINVSSDGNTGLGTSSAGTSHTFAWDTYSDLGNDFVGDVLVKIRAYDRDNYIGDFVDTELEGLSIMNAPSACTLTTPTDDYFQKDDTPTFVITIPADNNPEFYYSKLHAKIEVDITTDFDSERLVTFESRLDQTGWEYEPLAGGWAAIPAAGIPMEEDLVGQSVRFVVPTGKRLERTRLYWRATFGAVDGSAVYFAGVGILYDVQVARFGVG